jgi:hypothetical protein
MATFINYIIKIIIAPFLKIIRSIKKQSNIDALLRKLAKPFIKFIQSVFAIKPKSLEDYIEISDFLIVKKLLLIIILVICSIPLVYFMRFAKPVMSASNIKEETALIKTFHYDDIVLKDYTGKAIIKAADETIVYEGDIEAGKCTGQGTVYDLEGHLVYKGAMIKNFYMGEGELYSSSGELQYKGAFADNVFNGEGIYYDLPGNGFRQGTFKDGLLEGEGKVFNTNKQMIYEGNFAAGLYSGPGKAYVQNKLIYAGEFKEGKYEGLGKLYDKDGRLIYEGMFVQGKKHGKGAQYNPESSRIIYEGDFFENDYQGTGTLYNALGKEIYTGKLFEGDIDFTSLIGSSLQDISAIFKEQPVIVYSDDKLCYAYKDLGVVIQASADIKKAKEDFLKLQPENEEEQKEDNQNIPPVLSEEESDTIQEEIGPLVPETPATEEVDTLEEQTGVMMKDILVMMDLAEIKIEEINILKSFNKVIDEEKKVSEANVLIGIGDLISIKILQGKDPNLFKNIKIVLEKEDTDIYRVDPKELQKIYKKVYSGDVVQYELSYDSTHKKILFYKVYLKKG